MKKIKIITMIVLVILITMVSFFGVYVHVQNRMENQVRDYALDMDLDGARYVKLVVNRESTDVIKDAEGNEVEKEEEMTDEQLAENGYTKESIPNNSEDSLTVENYEKSKSIIEERLKEQGVEEYEISLNDENGDILIQIPENDQTDNFVSNMNTVGKFEIIDADTQEVLMDNGDIKLANVMYGTDTTSSSTGTVVYLNIEFNKEGTEKLKNISNTYTEVQSTDTNTTNTTDNTTSENTTSEDGNTTANTSTDENTTNETNTTENTTTTKEITMKIDDEEIMTTSFDEPIENGRLQLSIGSATTDTDTLQENINSASTMASVLDSGNLPIQYDIETNEYILSDITSTQIEYVMLAVGIVLLIGFIIFIIRYKLNGFLSSIAFIGLVSIYLLVIRYTNVSISIQGIVGIIVTIILNYIFINKVLSKIKKSEDDKKLENVNQGIKDSYKEFFIRIIPICISIIVLCFANWSTISSFGMVMFWGIALIAIYNYLITATMLKVKAGK